MYSNFKVATKSLQLKVVS